MSEKTEASNSPVLNSDATRVDRRKAIGRGLKLLARGLAGTLALQQITETEAKVKEEGIGTPFGTFYPLYEKHDVERNIGDISRPINGYFREAKPKYEFDASERLLTEKAKTFFGAFGIKESADQSAWPIDLLEELAKDNAPIILGDIDVPNISQMQHQLFFNSYLEATKTALGLVGIGAQLIGTRRQNEQLTRREFFIENYKTVAVWTGLILEAAPWLSRGPLAAAVSIDPEQKAPMTRVLTLPQNFMGQKEDYNAVVDQKITDETLLNQLKQKLPEYWAKEQEAKRLEAQEKAEEQRLGEEKRTQEVAKLREIFSYYTTPGITEQLNNILDQLVISGKDYERLVKVDTVSKENTNSYYITLALPQSGSDKPPATGDINARIIETIDDRVVSEQIEFYLDKNGKLTNRPNDDSITAPSDEELHQLLDSAVPLAKNPPGTPILRSPDNYEYKDKQGWLYYHISRGEGGKGFVGEFEDGNIRRGFIAQINGRVRVSAGVWPKQEIEKGVSTR